MDKIVSLMTADTGRIDTLKGFLADDPEDTFVIFALAKEYEKLNVLKKALDTYIHLLEVDPDYVGAYYHLANIYIQLGQKDEAMETYNTGISVAKKLADFHALSELHSAKTNLDLDL